VTGVHLVDRCARDRPGQLELAGRRHDVIPGGDHHRGGDRDLADPAGRRELAQNKKKIKKKDKKYKKNKQMNTKHTS
jgi:hypothetical protein